MNDAGFMPMDTPLDKSNEVSFSKREKIFSFVAAALGFVFVKCFAAPIGIRDALFPMKKWNTSKMMYMYCVKCLNSCLNRAISR